MFRLKSDSPELEFPKNVDELYNQIMQCTQRGDYARLLKYIYFSQKATIENEQLQKLACELIQQSTGLRKDFSHWETINPLLVAQAWLIQGLSVLFDSTRTIEVTHLEDAVYFNDPETMEQYKFEVHNRAWDITAVRDNGHFRLMSHLYDRISLPPYIHTTQISAICNIIEQQQGEPTNPNKKPALTCLRLAHQYITMSFDAFLQALREEQQNAANRIGGGYVEIRSIVAWRWLIQPVLTLTRMICRVYDTLTAIQQTAADWVKNKEAGIDPRDINDAALNLDYTLVPQFSTLNKISYLRQFTSKIQTLVSLLNEDNKREMSRRVIAPRGEVYVADQSLQLLLVAACTHGILMHYTSNSQGQNPLLNQLSVVFSKSPHIIPSPFSPQGQEQLSLDPQQYKPVLGKLDMVYYYYCLGRDLILRGPDLFYKANIALSKAYYLLLPLLCPVQKLILTGIGGNVDLDSVQIVSLPIECNSILKMARAIVKLLAPLRLYGAGGDFCFWSTPQNNNFEQINEIMVYSGIFTPTYLAKILNLPLYAFLSQAIADGNIYMFMYLEQKYRNYWIASGVFTILRSLEYAVWLRFLSNMHRLIVPALNQQYPHVLHLKDIEQLNHIQYEKFMKAEFFVKNQEQFNQKHQSRIIPTKPKLVERQFTIPTRGPTQFPPAGSIHAYPDCRVVITKYTVADIEGIIQVLIFSGKVRGYLKPNSALVLAKKDHVFPPSWAVHGQPTPAKDDHLYSVLDEKNRIK